MKRHFCIDRTPDFNVQIAEWIDAFTMDSFAGSCGGTLIAAVRQTILQRQTPS